MKQDEKPRNPVAQSPQEAFDTRNGQRGDAFGRVADDRRTVVGEFTENHADYAARGHQEHAQYRNVVAPRPREYDIDEFDQREQGRSMATHPLFRGLLQELPARSAPPSKEWLDSWTSTARSILDLLYSRDRSV